MLDEAQSLLKWSDDASKIKLTNFPNFKLVERVLPQRPAGQARAGPGNTIMSSQRSKATATVSSSHLPPRSTRIQPLNGPYWRSARLHSGRILLSSLDL
jgi:hypothetical protein